MVYYCLIILVAVTSSAVQAALTSYPHPYFQKPPLGMLYGVYHITHVVPIGVVYPPAIQPMYVNPLAPVVQPQKLLENNYSYSPDLMEKFLLGNWVIEARYKPKGEQCCILVLCNEQERAIVRFDVGQFCSLKLNVLFELRQQEEHIIFMTALDCFSDALPGNDGGVVLSNNRISLFENEIPFRVIVFPGDYAGHIKAVCYVSEDTWREIITNSVWAESLRGYPEAGPFIIRKGCIEKYVQPIACPTKLAQEVGTCQLSLKEVMPEGQAPVSVTTDEQQQLQKMLQIAPSYSDLSTLTPQLEQNPESLYEENYPSLPKSTVIPVVEQKTCRVKKGQKQAPMVESPAPQLNRETQQQQHLAMHVVVPEQKQWPTSHEQWSSEKYGRRAPKHNSKLNQQADFPTFSTMQPVFEPQKGLRLFDYPTSAPSVDVAAVVARAVLDENCTSESKKPRRKREGKQRGQEIQQDAPLTEMFTTENVLSLERKIFAAVLDSKPNKEIKGLLNGLPTDSPLRSVLQIYFDIRGCSAYLCDCEKKIKTIMLEGLSEYDKRVLTYCLCYEYCRFHRKIKTELIEGLVRPLMSTFYNEHDPGMVAKNSYFKNLFPAEKLRAQVEVLPCHNNEEKQQKASLSGGVSVAQQTEESMLTTLRQLAKNDQSSLKEVTKKFSEQQWRLYIQGVADVLLAHQEEFSSCFSDLIRNTLMVVCETKNVLPASQVFLTIFVQFQWYQALMVYDYLHKRDITLINNFLKLIMTIARQEGMGFFEDEMMTLFGKRVETVMYSKHLYYAFVEVIKAQEGFSEKEKDNFLSSLQRAYRWHQVGYVFACIGAFIQMPRTGLGLLWKRVAGQ